MTDHEADLVMKMIDYLTSCAAGKFVYAGQMEVEAAKATLTHLYELHIHRDCEVYNELCYLIVKEDLPIYSQLWLALEGMQTC